MSDREQPELPVDDYDAADDVTKAFEAAYEAIRERMANGGPGWEQKAQ